MSNFPDDFNPGLSGCFPPLRRNRPDYEAQVMRFNTLADRASRCANRLPEDSGDQGDSDELEAINLALAQLVARAERLAIP